MCVCVHERINRLKEIYPTENIQIMSMDHLNWRNQMHSANKCKIAAFFCGLSALIAALKTLLFQTIECVVEPKCHWQVRLACACLSKEIVLHIIFTFDGQ